MTMHNLKKAIYALVPDFILWPSLSLYHVSLAFFGAMLYGHPSNELVVIGVTGTKGKTSTSEYLASIFESAGHKVALINSIRIKIDEDTRRNTTGLSMPGHFFLQRFLRHAIDARCDIAVLEMTSQGAAQSRHRWIRLNALVFTNLAPEHIESHGSFEAYANAKFQIGQELARSPKRPRILVANSEDSEGMRYLSLPVEKALSFSLSASPHFADDRGGYFTFEGEKIAVKQPGEFSLKNALAAATLSHAFGISAKKIAEGLTAVDVIPGRSQTIHMGQGFSVVVDYAHTPDSLNALLDAYSEKRTICILGSAGGGRDTWKRPVMGHVAEENADYVILTNDDPYDEDPDKIIEEIAGGMKQRPEIIPDRREAIRRAISLAKEGDVVLITGKGIDPIAISGGQKIPWNDVDVAKEELAVYLKKRTV